MGQGKDQRGKRIRSHDRGDDLGEGGSRHDELDFLLSVSVL
jgi:hypothetical protein